MKYRAVLFDFGDTIVNFGPFDQKELIKKACGDSYRYLSNLGQRLPSMKNYIRRILITIKLKLMWSDITGNDFDAMDVLKKTGRKFGHQLTHQQWLELLRIWYSPLMEIGQVEKNFRETIDKLEEMGLSLGIVSNTYAGAEALDHHLRELNILEHFPVRVYSCNYKFRKPDKRIFKSAADKIGADFSEIVFVGDKIETDIAGSIGCGMLPVLKKAHTNEGKKIPENAKVINSLDELPGLISAEC
ncbi:HAD family hydrolase [Sedimentisphaera salicampi]|uniref:HAD family hydrolase n=1 Tax=Sedimentisphaera salicampi TaxID=1941349 RepID=UPI000B9C21E8|nr:HAD family hydrolase [Sedimentisphaera salicampi]OXU14917.1 Pyrimidine 5'-nucleotidase YjjG [Sedimentisphaera salicampi]